jgi:tetratricopeptide (TPR) repeat protein
LRFDPDRDPLFFTHHPNWNVPGLSIDPVGLVFQARRTDSPAPPLRLPDGDLPGESDPRVPKDYLTQNLIGHFHYMQGVTFEDRDWLRAQAAFARAMQAAPHNDVLFYNLGLIFRRNGLLAEAERAFERSHAINPRHIASKSEVRAADRLAEVRAEAARVEAVRGRLAGAPELAGLQPGTPAYHARLSVLLAAAGEPAAARAAQLEALHAASVDGLPPSS